MKNFVFRKEWREALKDYSAEVRAEVYEAILAYAFEGIVIEMSDLSRMAFNFIKLSIDAMQEAYKEKCERNRQKATKRWGGDAEVCQDMPSDANVCQTMPNDAEVCQSMPMDSLAQKTMPSDALYKYNTNQINTNQINSNQESVCEKTHTHTPTREEKSFKDFVLWCKAKAPLSLAFTEPLELEHFVWLYRKYGANRMKECASDLHNKEAYKSNRNAMNVWKKWIENVKLPAIDEAKIYRRPRS